jgi:flagellar protein FliT
MLQEEQAAPKPHALLERLSALTDGISHAVRLADWQEAARLADERSSYVVLLRKEHAAEGLDVIRRMQSIDAAILAEAQTAQTELQVEYAAAMQRIKAAGQYHRVALL